MIYGFVFTEGGFVEWRNGPLDILNRWILDRNGGYYASRGGRCVLLLCPVAMEWLQSVALALLDLPENSVSADAFNTLLAGLRPAENRSKKPRPFEETKKFKLLEGSGKNKPKRQQKDKAQESLDFSNDTNATGGAAHASSLLGNSLGQIKNGIYIPKEIEANAPKSSLLSYLKFASGTVLSAHNLEPVMLKMKEHLISRNVASGCAAEIVSGLSDSLIGRKLGALESVEGLVKKELGRAIERVLSPNASNDVVREILDAKRQGRPYSLAFVGVNGVGKSTSLSKICFWLLQNNFKVLIAACDTFRAGAVEQLKVHARNLSSLGAAYTVELFDKGYGKDPAAIAQDAIRYGILYNSAGKSGFDVVLIDTAGRMQDNEPLMRALAKLISVNDPDKILFVGEALVGNESIDQLTKFNQSIQNYSGKAKPRSIDAIMLTKFDTVDEQVGAAVSMTHTTKRPILFVGTGQTYTDMLKLNVESIVHTLLKK